MTSNKEPGFPFFIWRFVSVVVAWNLLALLDLYQTGPDHVGIFAILACIGLSLLSFTAPSDLAPGKWLLRRPQFAARWRWAFWYIGIASSGLAVLLAIQLLGGNRGAS